MESLALNCNARATVQLAQVIAEFYLQMDDPDAAKQLRPAVFIVQGAVGLRSVGSLASDSGASWQLNGKSNSQHQPRHNDIRL